MAGATRRRGAELDDALLGAAWDELSGNGYGRFTMEAVADRARTSRAVLYRRWPNRWDLAVAAVRHYGERHPVAAPDTGDLRGDLIAYLTEGAAKRSEVATLFSLRMAEYFEETGTSIAELRDDLLRGRVTGLDTIFERAAKRGEIDPDRLTPRLRRLPGDLLRQELMTTLKPVPEKVVAEMVDEIVLPLLTRP